MLGEKSNFLSFLSVFNTIRTNEEKMQLAEIQGENFSQLVGRALTLVSTEEKYTICNAHEDQNIDLISHRLCCSSSLFFLSSAITLLASTVLIIFHEPRPLGAKLAIAGGALFGVAVGFCIASQFYSAYQTKQLEARKQTRLAHIEVLSGSGSVPSLEYNTDTRRIP